MRANVFDEWWHCTKHCGPFAHALAGVPPEVKTCSRRGYVAPFVHMRQSAADPSSAAPLRYRVVGREHPTQARVSDRANRLDELCGDPFGCVTSIRGTPPAAAAATEFEAGPLRHLARDPLDRRRTAGPPPYSRDQQKLLPALRSRTNSSNQCPKDGLRGCAGGHPGGIFSLRRADIPAASRGADAYLSPTCSPSYRRRLRNPEPAHC